MHRLRSVLLAHSYIYHVRSLNDIQSREVRQEVFYASSVCTAALLRNIQGVHSCVTLWMRFNNGWKKKEHSYEAWERRYSTESHVTLVPVRVPGSSGLDVGEAGVGVAAAGRRAEVPRAAAFCQRADKQTHTVRHFWPTEMLVTEIFVSPCIFSCLGTWAGERLAGLGLSDEQDEVGGRDHALFGRAQISHKPAGGHTHKAQNNVSSRRVLQPWFFSPLSGGRRCFLTTVRRLPASPAAPCRRFSPPAPGRHLSLSRPLLCIYQHTAKEKKQTNKYARNMRLYKCILK